MTHPPQSGLIPETAASERLPETTKPLFMENVAVFPDGSALWLCSEAEEGSSPDSETADAIASPTASPLRCSRPTSPHLRELWLMAGVIVLLLLPIYWFPLRAKTADFQTAPPISCKTP